ncbi:MAG TPA: hypothetical protein VI055_08115 [Rubrobacter sp.]
MPQNAEHTFVPTFHERIKRSNPVASRFVDQLMGQGRPYPLALPTILHQRGVLGSFISRLAGVAYDGDDLVRVLGIQRDQAEVIHAIGAGEVAGLLVR